MEEDPVGAAEAHRPVKAPGLPAWLLPSIAGTVALGVVVYLGYLYLAPGSKTFAIDGVDATEWRASHLSQDPLVSGDRQKGNGSRRLRPEPSETIPAISGSAGGASDGAVAGVKPYSGVASVPLALVAPGGSSDTPVNPDSGQAAWAMVDPAAAIPADGAGNVALRQWFEKWQRGATEGDRDSEDLLSPGFQQRIESSSLPCPALYALGHSVGFVEGDKVAAVFYRVALSRAEQDLKSQGERSPSSLQATAQALYGMSETFTRSLSDYPTSERIFGLLQQYEKGNPTRQRRAAVLCAAAMRLQGPAKAQASAKLIEESLRDAQSADERRELACLLAQSLFDAGKYQEISAVLTDWQQHDLQAAHVEQGWMLLIRAASRCGQMEDARQTYARWKQKAGQGRTLPLDQEVENALASPK